MKFKLLKNVATLFAISAIAASCSTLKGAKDDSNSAEKDKQQYVKEAYGNTPQGENPVGGKDSYQESIGDNSFVADRVFFAFDSSNLPSEAKTTLKTQSDWIKKNDYSVAVEGHCDERGTREYNLALGEKRASATKNYLVSLGLDESKISTISYGKERPAVLGTGESVWKQNRRSVTVVVKK